MSVGPSIRGSVYNAYAVKTAMFFILFLVATKRLCMRVRPSVGPLVGRMVGLRGVTHEIPTRLPQFFGQYLSFADAFKTCPSFMGFSLDNKLNVATDMIGTFFS